jgi:pimeloyl-ACP methyl ester carboxylesterase
VREKVLSNLAETANGGAAGQVVVLVHGYSAPSVTTFDLDYQDYSWMNYLAERGFDTFALDLTGYGSSTRPAPMDNPCNLEPSEQRLLKLEPCEPTYPYTLTTLQSDWDDINAVVDYVQQLRGVTQVNLVGVSWGGARVLGYAATYPDKVDRIVVQGLAGAFSLRQSPDAPTDGLPMRISTQDELGDRWNPTIQCPDQVEPDMLNVVWHSLKASDPLGASWGMGVIRSPNFHPAGLTRNRVESITTPVLLVGGQHDNLASPWWMHRLYETLNTPDKVHMTLACTSHFISFETRKTFLYEASYDWFKNQSIAGRSQGSLTVEADDTYVWD